MEKRDISFLKDIHLNINARVGKTKKMLIDIISLKKGDIIELDANIDGYISLEINNQPFAMAEMVVVNEKYGVRIVDLA